MALQYVRSNSRRLLLMPSAAMPSFVSSTHDVRSTRSSVAMPAMGLTLVTPTQPAKHTSCRLRDSASRATPSSVSSVKATSIFRSDGATGRPRTRLKPRR
ncbi:hypothetical protein DQ04_11561000 [Trypanosoma grayi]|uniref:hypothetical protein n=1 Tax=Trypanosoma grayi TaxID=71804 RepID=UPI0004F47FAA|nr:hypothetical protein DQ04_11561000 [Trypanosoma grayi]KEG06941.1 hypothetical protein DQ04_11561000 [Trypanosoma grayi]